MFPGMPHSTGTHCRLHQNSIRCCQANKMSAAEECYHPPQPLPASTELAPSFHRVGAGTGRPFRVVDCGFCQPRRVLDVALPRRMVHAALVGQLA
jgi:hypothetical protein